MICWGFLIIFVKTNLDMEKHFVDYNQALALKELGFNESCLASWNFYTNEFNYNPYPSTFSSDDVIQLPLKSQVFEWFRKYRLSVVIEDYLDDYEVKIVEWMLFDDRITHEFPNRFDSWGDAESAAIDKLIEIVKNK